MFKKKKVNLIKVIREHTGFPIGNCIEIYKRYKNGELRTDEKVAYGLPINLLDIINVSKSIMSFVNDLSDIDKSTKRLEREQKKERKRNKKNF